jgi:branched-chain amino acid transport system substrate-binding protein
MYMHPLDRFDPHFRCISLCTTGSLTSKRNLESTAYLDLLLFSPPNRSAQTPLREQVSHVLTAPNNCDEKIEGMRIMKLTILGIISVAAIAAASLAQAASDIVIGDIDDLSGPYADIQGPAAVDAMKMAIVDFGGTVLGRKIVTLVADHQNKPDIGATKFREWAGQNGLNMLIGGSNTGVAIAMAKIAAAKKVPFFVVEAVGASLTSQDCTAYSVHYMSDTTALANGTATAIVKNSGKTWFHLTADYAFGTQLQNATSKVVDANGGKNAGAVRVPLAASDLSPFLLQAQASGAQVLALANAGVAFSNSLKAAKPRSADGTGSVSRDGMV